MAEPLVNGVVPPPYHITDDDKRGLVMVITTITVSFVIACLLVRIYVRTKVNNDWKRDDSLLAVATVFCCFQAATVYIQVQEGLGLRRLDPAKLERLGRANFAQQILYVFTLFLSKCVVLLLYLRLTAGRKHAMLAYITIGLCVVWAVVSIIMVSISCNPYDWFTKGVEVCGDITWRWLVIGIFDIITELLIFSNAIYLVAGLHMAFRLKMIVILAFSIRLPVIIASAMRMKYVRALPTSHSSSFEGAYSVVAGQFQLDFAIMASTISCIGPFLRPFEKDGGGSSYRQRYYAEYHGHNASGTGRSNPRSHGRSFNDNISFGTAIRMGPIGNNGGTVSSMASGQKQHKHKLSLGHRSSAAFFAAGPHSEPLDQLDLRPDFCEHEAGAARGSTAGAGTDLDALSLDSNDSKRMIISKKTVVRIEREGGEGESLGDRRSAGSGSFGDVGRAYSRT